MLDHQNRTEKNKVTERKFGITFGFVFLAVAALAFYYDWFPFWIAVAVAALFFLLGIFAPATLYCLNLVWFCFGKLLQKITNPIILGFMFFVVLLPVGLLRRLSSKRPFNKQFRDPDAQTYWLERDKKEIKFDHIF